MSALPFAHGAPPLSGRLRAAPEDFVVDEDLGFAADGTGEHVFVRVEKRGANTDFVAKELARFAGVSAEAVSYAGMKDRHAVTRQTFSLHLPGKADPDWSALAHAEFRVIDSVRHSRKLKRGALRGNRFVLRLSALTGDRAAADAALAAIAAAGVPNYFGEQRFGRGGDNLERARAFFAGQRLPRHLQGLMISSARSAIFNAALARRVEQGSWNRALDGEVWMLEGSHSVFGPEPLSDTLQRRLDEFDIHPTGPMWGQGELRSQGAVAAIEHAAAAEFPGFPEGLARAGLRQERRSLRLRPQELRWEWQDDDSLELAFGLPAGSYATGVVREVMDWGGSVEKAE
jgi:tRNA pseudouridine13 synthase